MFSYIVQKRGLDLKELFFLTENFEAHFLNLKMQLFLILLMIYLNIIFNILGSK